MRPFGKIVREERLRREWSAKEFLKRLGVKISPSYVTKIEMYDEIPSPSVVHKIAELFNIDKKMLLEAAKEGKRRLFNEMLDRKYELLESLSE